jgi:hypothetical protein
MPTAANKPRFEGPSPIQFAKEATPFLFETIHSYDGLERAPVAEYEDKDGFKFCKRVDDPRDAHFWSVYGYLPESGVECFDDFMTEQEATAFAEKLLSMFSNLRKYGLTHC